RRLVRVAGRKEAPGRPFLYETTREFLVAFGLRDLNDLPKVEGELMIPEVSVAANGQAQAEQDPGPGGADVTAGGGAPPPPRTGGRPRRRRPRGGGGRPPPPPPPPRPPPPPPRARTQGRQRPPQH